ncbi:uncharacterized protein [Leptinotarsa decemlineata]|uniref:uncharacterized protein n=1 Tax=Leptinotarsa decemlineata TaxID=7539 RepID=UPI003D30CCC4
MNSDAYKEWTDLFDSSVSEVWKSERKELQKSVMLLWTLKKELNNVHKSLEDEVSNLRQQLNDKDRLEKKMKLTSAKKKSPSHEKENRSTSQVETKSNKYSSNVTELESPDLFKNIDPNSHSKSDKHEFSNSMIIDLSLSDDDRREIDTSPTLISKYRKDLRKSKSKNSGANSSNSNNSKDINLVRKNIFHTPGPDLEMSVIDSTPDLASRKLKTDSKVSQLLRKKKVKRKGRNLTLTQIFPNSIKFNSNNDKKFDVGEDSDETYFENNKSTSRMGITDLLSYINKDESSKDNTFSDMDDLDSTQEVDQFSKGALLDESICFEEASPQKKLKLAVLPEPVVRGNARKDLNGFACEKCRNFYGQMNLSPEELQKKMDECSKHRYKYQPPEDTLPGIWDLTLAP